MWNTNFSASAYSSDVEFMHSFTQNIEKKEQATEKGCQLLFVGSVGFSASYLNGWTVSLKTGNETLALLKSLANLPLGVLMHSQGA